MATDWNKLFGGATAGVEELIIGNKQRKLAKKQLNQNYASQLQDLTTQMGQQQREEGELITNQAIGKEQLASSICNRGIAGSPAASRLAAIQATRDTNDLAAQKEAIMATERGINEAAATYKRQKRANRLAKKSEWLKTAATVASAFI